MDWVDLIKRYQPDNEQERKDKEIILHCIDEFKNILTRENKVVHVTSSAFVVNKSRDKALMVYHNIYDSWSWTGGHADGAEDLLAVAMREVKEETGVIHIVPVVSHIFALDVLPVLAHIKRGAFVSAHLHLSVAYLAEADENELLKVKADENSDVRWIPMDEINVYSNEPHMRKVYHKLISKTRTLHAAEQMGKLPDEGLFLDHNKK